MYDATGRRIRSLVRDELEQGGHEIAWGGFDGSGSRVANGVYFIRIVTPSEQTASRVVVMSSE